MLSQFNPVDHADGGRTWINSTDSRATSGERLATAELGVQIGRHCTPVELCRHHHRRCEHLVACFKPVRLG